MKACSICQHAKRDAIETDLLVTGDVDIRRLAFRYRVSKGALCQHVSHMGPVPEQANSGRLVGPVTRQLSEIASSATTDLCDKAILLDIGTRGDEEVNDFAWRQERERRADAILQVVRASHVDESQQNSFMTDDTPVSVLRRALPEVRRAFQLAGADREVQQQLVNQLNATVQQYLQAEDMGLP